jgi:hypothetical protein
MLYFVIGPDGTKYGPADIPTLNQWIGQGRVKPATVLEDAGGLRMAASAIDGLRFPSGPPNEHRPYYQNAYVRPVDDGNSDIVASWVLGALSLVFCPIIPSIFGLHFAGKAKEKGNPGHNSARIFNIVTMLLPILAFCFFIGLGMLLAANEPPRPGPRW